MPSDPITLCLRVLGKKVDKDTWSAHCLETDLVGYGKSFNEAMKTLIELTEMQVSFAMYKNQPALLDRPAPPEVSETYNSLLRKALIDIPRQKKRLDRHHRLGHIPIPNNFPSASFSVA